MTTNTAQSRAARLTSILASAPRVDLAGRDAVLDYVHSLQAEGVAVLPVVKGGKEPATDRGVHAATVDPATFDRMYVEGMNLGVNLGASHLVVVDADTPDEVAGLTSWWKLRHPDDDLPDPTTRTPGTSKGHSSGGHWWFVDAECETAGLKKTKLGLGDGKSAVAMVGPFYVLLPGSVRDDVADRRHPEYRTDGAVDGSKAAEGVVGWVKSSQPVRRAVTADYDAEGTDIDEWKVGVPWSDILGPGLGWSYVDNGAPCGCERWLRDGSDASHSAYAHTTYTCQPADGQPFGDVLKVFSDNGAPFETGRGYSKLQAYATLRCDGDEDAAKAELGLAGGRSVDLTHLGVNFDEVDLWADPLLAQVGDLADSLAVGRLAVVDLFLSTVGAHISPVVVMGGGRLGEASLNTLTVLIAASGVGKSSTMTAVDSTVRWVPVTEDGRPGGLVIVPDLTEATWTGEGHMRSLRRPVNDDGEPEGYRSVIHRQGEASALLAKAAGDKSTVMPVMTKSATGDGMGSDLAKDTDSYKVGAGSYRDTIQLAGQPNVVAGLFDGGALDMGLVGRMMVAEMAIDDDRLVELDRLDEAGELDDDAEVPVLVRLDSAAIRELCAESVTGNYRYATEPGIVRMLTRQKRRRNGKKALKARQASATGAAEGHLGLLTRKYATLFAIAKGEPVGWYHWNIAAALVAESQRTVAEWRADLAAVRKKARIEAAVADRDVERKARDHDPDELAARVVKWYLRKYGDAGERVKWSETYRTPLKGDDRKPYREQVRDLLADGFDERVTVVETPKGFEIGPA